MTALTISLENKMSTIDPQKLLRLVVLANPRADLPLTYLPWP